MTTSIKIPKVSKLTTEMIVQPLMGKYDFWFQSDTYDKYYIGYDKKLKFHALKGKWVLKDTEISTKTKKQPKVNKTESKYKNYEKYILQPGDMKIITFSNFNTKGIRFIDTLSNEEKQSRVLK